MQKFKFETKAINLEVSPELRGGMLFGKVVFQVCNQPVLRWAIDDLLCLWPFHGMLCELRALSLRFMSEGCQLNDDTECDAKIVWLPLTSTESLDGADYSVSGFQDEVSLSWTKWDRWGDDDAFPMHGRVSFSRYEFNEAIDAFSAYLQQLSSADE